MNRVLLEGGQLEQNESKTNKTTQTCLALTDIHQASQYRKNTPCASFKRKTAFAGL
jgi:hypothetical protein